MNAALAYNPVFFAGADAVAPAPARTTSRPSATAHPSYYDTEYDYASAVELVRAGDQDAARELVEKLQPLVMTIVRSRLSRRTSEEDIAQEIFLKVFAHLDQFRGSVPFTHWVSRIASRTCIDHLRLWKRRPEYRVSDLSREEADAAERVLATDSQPRPNDALAVHELVDKLVSELSPKDQMVIRLLDLEQKTLAEIEALTGWSQTLVKVRAFRARKKLQARFQHLRRLERS